MIAKAKAISHGKNAIEYAMRESKKGNLITSNLVQSETPDEIHKEFLEAQKYNSRCKNKFIRIEIGIAPQDEAKLTDMELRKICKAFNDKFGFSDNQWIACTHKDTDNLHIHMIVNRVSIDNKLYQTDFISKRAGKIAEEISREMGLTIANSVTPQQQYKKPEKSPVRLMARDKITLAAADVLRTKPKTLTEFSAKMEKHGVTVSEAINKKGNTYGLRFSAYGETFKASQIGKEFGFRTLMQTFSENKQQSIAQENRATPLEGLASTAGAILSGLGSLFTPTNNPDEYTPTVTDEERKRKLKKKRRYGRQL